MSGPDIIDLSAGPIPYGGESQSQAEIAFFVAELRGVTPIEPLLPIPISTAGDTFCMVPEYVAGDFFQPPALIDFP